MRFELPTILRTRLSTFLRHIRVILSTASLAGIVLGTSGALLPFRKDASPQIIRDGLDILPESYRLGDVNFGTHHVHQIDFLNSGRQRIAVHNISAGCDCIKISPQELSIPPNGHQSITLTIDTSRYSFTDNSAAFRDLSIDLRLVAVAAEPVGHTWSLRGRLRRQFLMQPQSLHFASTDIAALATDTRAVSIGHIQQRRPIRFRFDSAILDVREADAPTPQTRSGLELQVSVAKERLAISGDFTTTIDIFDEPTPEGATPVQTIRVSGTIPADIVVAPQLLQFGTIRVGSTVSRELTVASRSNRPFLIEHAEIVGDGDHLSLDTITAPAPGVAGFRVVANPIAPAIVRASLRLSLRYTTRGNQPPIDLTVPVGFYATPAMPSGE